MGGWLARWAADGSCTGGARLQKRVAPCISERGLARGPGATARLTRRRLATDGNACTDTRCADVGCFFRPERPSHELISLLAGIDRRGGWLARRRLLREGFVWVTPRRTPSEALDGDRGNRSAGIRGKAPSGSGFRKKPASVGVDFPQSQSRVTTPLASARVCVLRAGSATSRPAKHRRRLPG